MLINDFPSNYEIIINPELPGTGEWGTQELYLPFDFRPKPNEGHLIVKIKAGQRWQVWHIDSGENSDIWTTPDPDRMLITGIEGLFYVSAKDPEDAIKIAYHSSHVTPVTDRGMLLLNDYFGLMALDRTGICWQAPGLVDDDMTILAIEGNKIVCSGFSVYAIDEKAKIILDVGTGTILENTSESPKESSFQRFRTRLLLFRRGKSSTRPDSVCEVCGYYTFFSDERGSFFICPVCFWEDDEFHKNPDEPCDGPNHGISLNQARRNYHKFGASRKEDATNVRKPLPEEIRG